MWRFASLYGIGKRIGRSPFFDTTLGPIECMRPAREEAKRIFPEYSKRMYFLVGTKVDLIFVKDDTIQFFQKPATSEKNVLNFAQHCCKYEDPEKYVFGLWTMCSSLNR